MTAAWVAGMAAGLGVLGVRAVLHAGDRAAVLAGARPGPVRPPARLVGALGDAGLAVDPGVAWPVWLVVAPGSVGLGLVAGGPPLAAVLALVVAAAPVLVLGGMRGRASAAVDAALPELLDAVARSVRSGATVHQSLRELGGSLSGRLGDDVRAVVDAAAGGLSLAGALDRWPARCPTPGVRLTVAALGLSAEAGGAAAQAIDGVAATLRSNLAVAGEVRAQAAQARLSGMVIAASPLAFGLLAAGTDRRTAAFLLRTPFGAACLAGGIALDGVAAWWMHRITAAPA